MQVASKPAAPRRPDLRFPREARLTASAEFEAALKTRPVRGKLVWMYCLAPLPTEPQRSARPRLGLMVTKRLARTAVLRNAIKRRLREQFRLRQPNLPPMWFVARLAAPAEASHLPAIVSEWSQMLDRTISHSRGRPERRPHRPGSRS